MLFAEVFCQTPFCVVSSLRNCRAGLCEGWCEVAQGRAAPNGSAAAGQSPCTAAALLLPVRATALGQGAC